MIEVGKLYKSFREGLVECIGISEEEMHFRRVTTDYWSVDGEWSFAKNEAFCRIEREATVEDIENAMEDSLDRIEDLRNAIDGEHGVIRDLDEWRDRLD